MTEIYVRNFRRIRSADLACADGGIILVMGRNQQGKSSIAEAVQAGLTGTALPTPGDADAKRAQQRANEFVHDGAETGSVVIKTSDGVSSMAWPKCEFVTDGEPLRASPLSTALHGQSLPTMAPAARLKLLRDVLGGEPTKDDLIEFLTTGDVALSEKQAEVIWNKVDESDWDDAWRSAHEVGAETKGVYRAITGEAWGAKKAPTWKPPGWQEEWTNTPLADVESALQAAQAALEKLIAEQGSSSELARQRAEAEAALSSLRPDMKTAEGRVAELEELLQSKESELQKVEYPDALHAEECPHCGESVMVIDRSEDPSMRIYSLVKGIEAEMPPERMAEYKAAIAGLRSAIFTAKSDLTAARQAVERLAGRILEKEGILAKAAPEVDTDGIEQQIAEQRQAVAEAERKRDMFVTLSKSLQKHKTIVLNAKIQQALSEKGVRAKAMETALKRFEETVNKGAQWAWLGRVSISPEIVIAVDQRPYRDLSGSEKLRLRAVLQGAIAAEAGDDMIVIDLDEATDKRSIIGIVRMLTGYQLSGVVCAHAEAKEAAINLQTPGAKESGIDGYTYWVENGATAVLT